MKTGLQALFFDFDGVILDSAGIKTQAFRKLFEREHPEHVPAILSYHIEHMGISRYAKFRHIYDNILGLPIDRDLEDKLGRSFSDIVLEEVLRAPFLPGVQAFLESACGAYDIFVVSGTPHEELLHIVGERGLNTCFQEVLGAPPGKPEIIRYLLNKYDLEPERCVFVGDAISDLKAAGETGLHFVAVHGSHDDSMKNCEHLIHDMGELQEIIGEISENVSYQRRKRL